MERLWIALYIFLTFVFGASCEKVVLMQTPDCDACVWTWENYYLVQPGWHHPTGRPQNRYTLCDGGSPGQQPNRWLRSRIIAVGDTKRLDVTVKYYSHDCQGRSFNFCNESFFAYVWESNTGVTSDKIPHPINSFGSYRIFGIINRNQSVLTLPLEVNSTFIVLGFRDQGGCRTLFSVKVSYTICPQKTLEDSLVSLTQTSSTFSIMESIPVNGNCTTDSVQAVQGSMVVHCESSGEWNTSSLQGRCFCKENKENIGGVCKACPRGTYNEGNGLNCTVIPSEPRHPYASFVNQSSAVISWSPPATIGTKTDVLYDIVCQKSCDYYGKSCDDEECHGEVSYLSQTEELNMTNMTITNLGSFVNYTCKISAKNRVSKVAERKYGVKGNFTLVNLRTNGTAPGKPEIAVHLAEDGNIELTWTLKCKNGIITGYRVTYFRMDDPSDTETLTTKTREVRINSLTSGKSYEFRVSALNNFGTGPPGVKTFKIPNGGIGSTQKSVQVKPQCLNGCLAKNNSPRNPATIIAISVVSGVIILTVLISLGICIYRQRQVQARLEERLEHLQAGQVNVAHEEQEIHMDVVLSGTTSDDTIHHPAEYMDISDIHSFELERDDIKFVMLLGSGNFGEVFKATLGNDTVAVKSLKDTATPKDKVDMIAELNVMKSLKPHPHVLKLIGCCGLGGPLLIVLEYLPYGDLLGYLRKSRGHPDSYNSGEKKPTRLTAKDLLSFAWMIADGMKYLSKMKIVHRDLAARNILVGESKVCKVSDFGLARDVNADIYVRTSQARLPVKWMPPESLFRGESSTMSDVWSYGIVLWEVFTIGDSPYPGVKAKKVASLLERGYRMPRPIHISEELFSIMSECWSEKPEDRPTFQWICAAVKRLINNQKNYVNLDVYNDEDYVNFDMFD